MGREVILKWIVFFSILSCMKNKRENRYEILLRLFIKIVFDIQDLYQVFPVK